MTDQLKTLIIGSPLERLARRFYIRFSRSPGSHYDRLTLAVMRRCLRPNSNCVDIGAHRGTILAEIVRMAPEGFHYAFEPIPEHSDYLAKSFPTVQVYQLALSNVSQLADFIHDCRYPTRSSFKQLSSAGPLLETITVQTDLLDNIIPSALQIQFIKLDVEGAEYQVLRGAVKMLRANQPVLVFEHVKWSRECYGVSSQALYELLTKECRLSISLPGDWLQNKTALSCGAFLEEVEQARELYFVAHP